jgi:hypothetical protein
MNIKTGWVIWEENSEESKVQNTGTKVHMQGSCYNMEEEEEQTEKKEE